MVKDYNSPRVLLEHRSEAGSRAEGEGLQFSQSLIGTHEDGEGPDVAVLITILPESYWNRSPVPTPWPNPEHYNSPRVLLELSSFLFSTFFASYYNSPRVLLEPSRQTGSSLRT